MPGLLDRRLIFVTGKGGVGKSTVAIALGLVAARRGLRTIVAELASQSRVRDAFQPGSRNAAVGETGSDGHAGGQEVELAERLFTISIDPQSAMEEYLRVKTGAVGQVLGSSRLFAAFAMATPGMRELLSIGKVWELAQLERRTHGADAYDLVIVDSPAAGHGVGILRTPRTFAEIARVGPIAHQGATIAATIADHEFTAVIGVTTAEEMPVNETLWLRDALAAEQLRLDAGIVNALYRERFASAERATLESARARRRSPLARAALAAALSEQARAEGQREQLARLHGGLGMELLELPYLFAEQVGPPELELLADALDRGLREPALALNR
ncbi:MAG: ArsA family ATPase [Solirubrobacteraceae bacterium]